MTYCRCYSCKYLLRYELKTECGQICAFFVTAGVGLMTTYWSTISRLASLELPLKRNAEHVRLKRIKIFLKLRWSESLPTDR